jgi:nucleoside-diphosphate-sugar epimerase
VKVLVTGASGFIGRRVVARLVRDGRFEIIAASRRSDPQLPPGVRHEAADLLAPGAAADLVDRTRPTHLIHLAWNATPGVFWNAPDNLDWTAATLSLVRAFARAGGRRATLAGTCAEYDWTDGGTLSETSPIGPATFYGVAKDATRRLVCGFGERHDVSIAWGRVFWLYGPGEAPGRLVSDVCRSLLEGRPVETSHGRQIRDFMHVDDVAGAFVTSLESDWRGPFNIGSGDGVAVREVLEALGDAAGRPELIEFGKRPTAPNDPALLACDAAVLRERIGFSSEHALRDGLRETYAWWARRLGAS